MVAVIMSSLRRLVFLVTSTVSIFLLARSLNVIVPVAGSMVAITPDRFSNAPLTTSSAWTEVPSADFVPFA